MAKGFGRNIALTEWRLRFVLIQFVSSFRVAMASWQYPNSYNARFQGIAKQLTRQVRILLSLYLDIQTLVLWNIFAFNYSLCILECRPCIWYNYTSDSLTRFAPGLIKFSFSPDIILLVLFASLNIQTVLYSSYYVCCWIYNCWFNWFRVFLETAILYSITCDFLVHFPASPDELFDSYKFTNVMYPRFLLKFVSNR